MGGWFVILLYLWRSNIDSKHLIFFFRNPKHFCFQCQTPYVTYLVGKNPFMIFFPTSWAALVSNSLFGWILLRLYQILLLKRCRIFLSNWIRKVWANFLHDDYIQVTLISIVSNPLKLLFCLLSLSLFLLSTPTAAFHPVLIHLNSLSPGRVLWTNSWTNRF